MFLFNFRNNINITFRNKEQLSTFWANFGRFWGNLEKRFFKALIMITAHERDEFLQITRNRKNHIVFIKYIRQVHIESETVHVYRG